MGGDHGPPVVVAGVRDYRKHHGGEGVRFLLQNAARRGRPLREGQIVSSGAVTGVHQIRARQEARLVFEGVGEIRCRAEA